MSCSFPLLEYTRVNPVIASDVSGKLFYKEKKDAKMP